jgi:hypothetical protein
MRRLTHIRWDRAARLGGAGAVAIAAVVAAPSLLRPDEPPPLAPDIGLVPATLPPEAAATAGLTTEQRPRRGGERSRRARPSGRGARDHDRGPTRGSERSRRPAGATAPVPARSIAVAPVSAPPIAAVTYPAVPTPTRVPGHEGSDGAPEFGFER